jgi:hypothetical protein
MTETADMGFTLLFGGMVYPGEASLLRHLSPTHDPGPPDDFGTGAFCILPPALNGTS